MGLLKRIKELFPLFRFESRLVDRLTRLEVQISDLDKKNETLFWLLKNGDSFSDIQLRRKVFHAIPKATGNLRCVQVGSNSLLRRIKSICDENGIDFFLIGGTLIGAVRHDGFIPWDDDIDIGMLWEDYERLCKCIGQSTDLAVDYYYKKDSGFRVPKVKYRENDTFWVDIFLFDYLYSSDIESDWKKHLANCYWFRNCIVEEEKKQKNYSIVHRNYISSELDMKLHSAETKLRADELYHDSGKTRYLVDCFVTPYWETLMTGYYLSEDCFPLMKSKVIFEEHRYDVWKNFDLYLKKSYGDIWSFPRKIDQMHETEFQDDLSKDISFLQEKGIIGEGDF